MIRRVVARKMTQAAADHPGRHAPPGRLVRATAARAAATWARHPAGGPASTRILAAIVGRALAAHDLLNGSWVETPPAVLVHPERNVAIAVDTPHGARGRGPRLGGHAHRQRSSTRSSARWWRAPGPGGSSPMT